MEIKRNLAALVTILVVHSCHLSSTDYNWDVISSGKGTWNVDELRVTNIYGGNVTSDTTYFDHGTIEFSGTENAPAFKITQAINLKTFTLGPLAGPLSVSASSLYFDLNTGSGLSANFIDMQIIKIDRNELILFAPWSLNTILDGAEDVDFYFKLSKQ